jgi:hypothetical protein
MWSTYVPIPPGGIGAGGYSGQIIICFIIVAFLLF